MTCASWRRRKKHVLAFSNAGKPIFSRYGDEQQLSTFMAAAQAILSFVGDKWGDRLSHMDAPGLRAVFLERGPLTFACVSRTGEPASMLRSQLEMLHSQFIAILTSGIDRAFARSANFDMRQLLGGTGPLLRSVIHGGAWHLPVVFDGVVPLAMPPQARKALAQSLQASFVSDTLCSLVFTTDGKLLCLSARKRFPLDARDLYLFMNFCAMNRESFRQESFVPYCFQAYNPSAFCYAYVHVQDALVIAFVTARADSFHECAQAKAFVARHLHAQRSGPSLPLALSLSGGDGASAAVGAGRLVQVTDLPMSAGGGALGTTPLWHYVYVGGAGGRGLRQIVAPEFGGALASAAARKHVLRLYRDARGKGRGESVRWCRTPQVAVLACVTPEFSLFAALDALTDPDQAVRIANALVTWLQAKEDVLFSAPVQLKSSARVRASARRALNE